MKADEVEARAGLLRIWLERLRGIKSACEKVEDYFERRGPDRPGDHNQVLQDRAVFWEVFISCWFEEETWQPLLEGLERAINGELDPFRLKVKHRKPAVPRADRIKAVIEVLKLKEDKSLFNALLEVAGKFGVSERTIRDWYDDPDTRYWAEVKIFHEQFTARHPPSSSWSSEIIDELFNGMKRIKAEAQSLRERKQSRRKRQNP